jgi:hypothetical protein
LYDTSPTMIPLRRIDSEIIHFGRTNHQPDNAVVGEAPRELHTIGFTPLVGWACGVKIAPTASSVTRPWRDSVGDPVP